MIPETFNEIEVKIRSSKIGEAEQRELLGLLAKLKTEISESQTQNLAPLKGQTEELRSSVEGFEQSHPKLVQAVNTISKTLSDLGI